MPTRTTVSNTSPLFYLHRLGQLELLPRLYGSVLVPEEVARELERGRHEGHDAPNLAVLDWASVHPVSLPASLESCNLDPGELAAIALALTIPGCRLLLDDREARREALARQFLVTGTLGALDQAKREGLLTEVKPWVDRLRQLGFRISPALYATVLEQVGESPS